MRGRGGNPPRTRITDDREGGSPSARVVAVGERVDGLEVGVDDGRARERREVASAAEGHKILQGAGDSPLGGRNEEGVDGCEVGSSDPDRLGAQTPGDVG